MLKRYGMPNVIYVLVVSLKLKDFLNYEHGVVHFLNCHEYNLKQDGMLTL